MNEVAIVTGASRGIGAATARLLAERGCRVCVNYRTEPEAAERLCAQIEAGGGRAIAVAADVSDAGQVERLFATVERELGPLTALVNNAATIGPTTRVADLELADLQRVLAVNVVGVVLCTQHALRRMAKSAGGRGGAIVNVSSGAAYIGGPGASVHYAASKGAVNSFTIGVAQEAMADGGPGKAVSPGLTDTPMGRRTDMALAAAAIPAGRVAEPEEVAEAIVWLLSPQARFVAAANIRVAGGRP